MDNVPIALTLPASDVNLILTALGERPYREVAGLIHNIKTQGDAGIAAARAAAVVPASSDDPEVA